MYIETDKNGKINKFFIGDNDTVRDISAALGLHSDEVSRGFADYLKSYLFERQFRHKIKPLNPDSYLHKMNLLYDCEDLKELIFRYPNYPILFTADPNFYIQDGMTDSDVQVTVKVGEILDCEQDINDEKVYTDRDDFENDVCYVLTCDLSNIKSGEQLRTLFNQKCAEYEEYWTPCIIIRLEPM